MFPWEAATSSPWEEITSFVFKELLRCSHSFILKEADVGDVFAFSNRPGGEETQTQFLSTPNSI
jgi:hypothetical protein